MATKVYPHHSWIKRIHHGYVSQCNSSRTLLPSNVHLRLKTSSMTTVGMEKRCMLHFVIHERHLTVGPIMFDTLFELLLSKYLCLTIAKLLSHIYSNEQCQINYKWCGAVSSSFGIKNGVKHIYLDELFVETRRLGC